MNIDKTTGLPEVPVEGAYWEVRKVRKGEPIPGKPNDIFRVADSWDAGYYIILAKDVIEEPTVVGGWFRKRTYEFKAIPKQEVIDLFHIQTLLNPLEKDNIIMCAQYICKGLAKKAKIDAGERFLGKYPPNKLTE